MSSPIPNYRLFFVGDPGGDFVTEHLGDFVTNEEVAAAARAYLETQWTDEDRQFYLEAYNDGMALIAKVESCDLECMVTPVEYGSLVISR
jgi:hypothetical protein